MGIAASVVRIDLAVAAWDRISSQDTEEPHGSVRLQWSIRAGNGDLSV